MSALFEAVNNTTTTTNGMPAYKSTMNKNLDLFGIIGTARGTDISDKFEAAYKENSDLALRILQWGRDVRGGAGERQRFRDLLKFLSYGAEGARISPLIDNIPNIGRFDDLHTFIGTPFEDYALLVHARSIQDGNGLACKWAPRKGPIAYKLRSILGMSPKRYRKTIVNGSKTVEQQMCAQQWNEIEYSHVPSQAARIYRNAFKRHDEERYEDYLNKAVAGEVKMNATATFPYEVLRSDGKQMEAQWKNLPNYLEGTDERILCVCDVSGSMSGLPMEVSVSLGMYFSERLEGVFKDQFITFSVRPAMHKLSGSVQDRKNQLLRADWGYNTNFEAVFDLILNAAIKYDIPQDQMPTKILAISDMQFDVASEGNFAVDMIREKYRRAGYEMPQLVFWNVAGGDFGNTPVKFNDKGVALVSGASPSAVKCVLSGKLDPIQVMLDTVMIDRYKLF